MVHMKTGSATGFVSVLVVSATAAACIAEEQCVAHHLDNDAYSTQSLIQKSQKRQTGQSLEGGLSRWASAEVKDQPPVSPPLREFPTCHMSNLTGACLPGFQVIGVQKCATSTLFNILRQHPHVKPANKKELLYFNGNYRKVRCDPPDRSPTTKEFRRYLLHFPRLFPDSGAVTAEFSASYFHCWCCPSAFKRLMPNLRLIVMLRDPIDRARSRWAEQKAKGFQWELGTFEEYVDRYLSALEACLNSAAGSYVQAARCAGQDNILGLSLYEDAFSTWFEHFQPRDILVTYLEQLKVEPEAVVRAIHAHLGLQNFTYPGDVIRRRYNGAGHYGWSTVATLQTGNGTALERLYRFYRPHLERLRAMADAGLITALPESWISRWSL